MREGSGELGLAGWLAEPQRCSRSSETKRDKGSETCMEDATYEHASEQVESASESSQRGERDESNGTLHVFS